MTQKFDEAPVLKDAAEQAKNTDKDHYVIMSNAKWKVVEEQPEAKWTHWKVTPLGKSYANYGSPDKKEHEYIEDVLLRSHYVVKF